ncbi:isopenicillin N synthase family oxygenase [Mangrovimicrobium sediminis]|uniref:2-oxoglutarate-dependent ethylene/succinate-forming enzyme n=1 Tax=Mangrovimicrobium sediminis TaxID=2562682 RepID=A0A4Z0M546_9GAMM|nr:2-oxoglutarate and iron-dependent oxygenase domain-containing protein [Haliea sp. SAOS-164]TGD74594.1 isopenicillin N synthase family oxygenase [Haliea sp. SAOS-164]
MSDNASGPAAAPAPELLEELRREQRMGGAGTEDAARSIPVIDLSEGVHSQAEIDDLLWDAAENHGFFQLVGHGFGAAELDRAFAMAQAFFELPREVKQQYPLREASNAGWEYMAQVRPSTGTADHKESYQVTRPRMDGLWPDDEELAGFREAMLLFEAKAWRLAMRVLSSFARKLGFADDFFTAAHDPSSPRYQSTLRLLHYFGSEGGDTPGGQWRAGAHTDFDCLTLLFQRDGQGGLQVCPGKERESGAWTPVPPDSARITCNIGDMLMRWSDDQLRSTLHRVRMPLAGEDAGDRYTLAFFAQANCDQLIRGPQEKYPPILARDYLNQRIGANFAALQAHDDAS